MNDKNQGYKINEKDIEVTLRYLKLNENEDATREDAVEYLKEHQDLAHLTAHRIVEDEQRGKIEQVEADEPEEDN